MLLTLAIARLFTGDFPGARAAAERGLALARRTRQGLLTPAFLCVRGFVDQELGRLEAAQADQEEALDSALLSGNVQVAYWASIESSVIALQRGQTEAALEHGAGRLGSCSARASTRRPGSWSPTPAWRPATRRARAAALEAFGWVRPQMWTLDRVKAADVAVRVLLALGRLDEAAAWADRVPIESGGRRTGIFGAIAARSRAARAAGHRARRARRRGSPPPAPPRPTPAMRRCGPARCRTLAGRGAGGRRAPGRRARAAAPRRRPSSMRFGAFGPRDAALRVLRRLGDRPRPPARGRGRRRRRPRLAALSPREREVAMLVAAGRTNAQIAAPAAPERAHRGEARLQPARQARHEAPGGGDPAAGRRLTRRTA